MTTNRSPYINDIHRYSIGLLAGIASISFLYDKEISLPLLIASVFLLIISITDTFYMKIPNLLNLILIILGFSFHAFTAGTGGLGFAAGGCFAGFALFFPGYLFRMLGAGDVKALAALGALTGATAIFQIFLYTSLIGGGLALIYLILSSAILKITSCGFGKIINFVYTKDFRFLKPAPTNIRFPYAAAIAFGYFAYIQWGNII